MVLLTATLYRLQIVYDTDRYARAHSHVPGKTVQSIASNSDYVPQIILLMFLKTDVTGPQNLCK